MITKDFIKFEEMNPDYIRETAEAIVKESEKDVLDMHYIIEKCNYIKSFCERIVEANRGVRGEMFVEQQRKDLPF
jgi:hypothetical protein